MRGIVRWQNMAEGMKHAASPWVGYWPCSSPCFAPFTCSAHSSCFLQQELSLSPVLTAGRVLNLTPYEMQHPEKSWINNRWWKPPAQLPRVLTHPTCRNPAMKRAHFPNIDFSVHHLCGLQMIQFGFKGVSRKGAPWAAWSSGRCPCPWQGGWNEMIFKVPSSPSHPVIVRFCGWSPILRQPRLPVGGFALCWIKPDLLEFFCWWIFGSQWLVLPRGTSHLENSSSQTNIFKPTILFRKVAGNWHSGSECAGEDGG